MAKNKYSVKIIALTAVIIFSAVFLEIMVRVIGHYDPDGNFFFFGRQMKPYRVPVQATKEKIKIYLESPDKVMRYDTSLGWAPEPSSVSRDKLYKYNSDGIRTENISHEFTEKPEKGVLRIAVFGDSFVHGNEAEYDETLCYWLENKLNDAGIKTEVMNFGVPGYGMDQAFLRWEKSGKQFSPQIVIFGFQAENTKRNLNVLRPLYCPEGGLPFSKPRFVLENKSLKLVNSPAPSPSALYSIIGHLKDWDMIKYEHWFNAIGAETLLFRSKLISLLSYLWDKSIFGRMKSYDEDKLFYSINDGPAKLALWILNDFKYDVQQGNHEFYIVHLPTKDDLELMLSGKDLSYKGVLASVKGIFGLIDPADELLKAAMSDGIGSLYNNHYSSKANEIIAGKIAAYLVNNSGLNQPEG